MLKVKIDDNHDLCDLMVTRTSITDLATDVALIIHAVYNSIRQSSPESAALFKELILHVVDGDCPVWTEQPVDCLSVSIPVRREGGNDD